MKTIHDWNNKLYPIDKQGKFTSREIGAEYFWREFGIKSAPLFQEYCWYHIPQDWKDDVSDLIRAIQDRFPRLVFVQIKEKMASLVIYYDCEKEDRDEVKKMIEECRVKLRAKSLHP